MDAAIGPELERKSLNVVDRRLLREAEASVALDGETQSVDPDGSLVGVSNKGEEVTSRLKEELNRVDPIDVLLGKTFQFILAQPEWLAVLNLPREDRKRLENAIAKMLTRFPHMTKQGMNE